MKPNAPGEWHSRDGRRAVAFYSDGVLVCRTIDQLWNQGARLPGDDWLPAVAPEFPELPPKPSQCYTKYYDSDPAWRQFGTGLRDSELRQYNIIPHPDNDPEAERMIEEAKS